MVKLLLLNLFIPFITYCQVDHIVIKKEKSTSLFAKISGYSEGEIRYSLICSEIEANNFSNYEVTEFKISFGIIRNISDLFLVQTRLHTRLQNKQV